MEVIDAQMHIWQVTQFKHWHASYTPLSGSDVWTYDSALSAMEAVGVAAAVLDGLPSVAHRLGDGTARYSNRYAEEAATKYPGVFGSMAKLDPRSPDIESLVEGVRQRPGVVGLRLTISTDDEVQALTTGDYDAMFAAAQSHKVCVSLFVSRQLDLAYDLVRRFPDLQIIIDHLGLPQPPLRELDSPPFAKLPVLLGLAEYANVAVKLIGGPAYSLEPYPYRDVWPALRQVVDAFGCQRVMWGSDLTRLRGLYTYADLLGFVLHTDWLTEAEKEWVLGKTLRTVFRWDPNAVQHRPPVGRGTASRR
jgi:predicted TIM-barrel fold metal-dependent hydrolase